MSEPARQLLPNDHPTRPQPGPLRDWLATMKAKNAAQAPALSEARPDPVPGWPDAAPAPMDVAEEAVTILANESGFPSWTPDVITPSHLTTLPHVPALSPVATLPHVPAPSPVATPSRVAKPAPRIELPTDYSELMAENLMLKAKLQVETTRYDSLQAILAEEIGGLRSRFEVDMKILDEVCAERDQLKTLTATVARKMRDMTTKLDAETERLTEARSERDLWMARAEALAQPLFQGMAGARLPA